MSKPIRKDDKTVPVANAKILYLRLIRYAWQHRFAFVITIIATAFLSASNTGFLALIKKVTDEGFAQQAAGHNVLLPLMLFGLKVIRGVAGRLQVHSTMNLSNMCSSGSIT
jgi:subfamily B ATP-binding cassette protein MsbA